MTTQLHSGVTRLYIENIFELEKFKPANQLT